MSKYSLTALAAAGLLVGGFSVGSASAADLGGDCCADLEERVAELEATTARKGNRKVSLTISGFVAQQVMWWDDGDESNVYITDTGAVSIGTHVKFSGEAVIVPGWSAGYVLNIEFIQNDSLLTNQRFDDGIITGNAQAAVGNGGIALAPGTNQPFASPSVAVESSYWFVKSDHWGRLSVGQQSSAADNQAILPDGSGSLVVANYVLYDINAFQLRHKQQKGDGGLAPILWGDLANCSPLDGLGGVAADCDGFPNDNVRYDTPTFAGFSASASWGEDDIWAVSGRYAGEWAGFKVAAAVAYNHSGDENGPGGFFPTGNQARLNGGLSVGALQAGAYVEHVATGVFVYGAYGREYNTTTGSVREFVTGNSEKEGSNWYVKAGLREKWIPLGHTVLYGEYGQDNDKFGTFLYDAGVNDSRLTQYGGGIVQEIDAAAMSVWLSYRHYSADIQCDDDDAPGGTCFTATNGELHNGRNGFDDLQIVKGGALISF